MFPQPNTPFGGGFGQPQQQQQQQSAFGSPAPAPLFGSPAPAPAFGGSGTTFGGAGGGFGGGSSTAPAPSIFGGGAPAPTAFGAPTSAFGQPAPAPTFGGGFGGAPAPTPGPFGAAPAAPAPGPFAPQAAPATNSPFGAPPAPSAFGQPQQAPTAFGQPQQQQQQQSAFGSTTFGAPAPAGQSLFGGAPTAFGGAPSSGFGAPAPSSTFGAPAPAVGLFGAAQQPAPATSFGAPAAPAANLFGSPPAPAATTAGGGSMGNYAPTTKQDGTTSIVLHAISAMPQFEKKCFEELRFEDYAQGNKGSTPQQGNTAGFGSTFGGGAAAPAPGTNLFGATPAAPFGQQQQQPAPAGLIFGGGSPAPAPFGSPAPAQQPFGQQPAPAPSFFGGSTPAPAPTGFGAGLFGGAQSSTPAPAPTFGQGSLFGVGTNTPAPAPFGTPAPANTGFGSFAQPAPAPSLFGNPAPAPTFGQQNLFGGGNAPAPAPLFGGAAPAPFGGSFGGAATPQPAPAGMFGSSPAPAPFGAPAGGMFGGLAPAPFGAAPQQQQQQQPQQQQQQYGGYAGQPQPLFAPNVQILTSPANEVLEQTLRAMENQRKELEKAEVWRSGSSPSQTSATSTPTSLYDTAGNGSFLSPAGRLSALSFATPRSGAKIRPRGFPKSVPAQASQQALVSRRDDRGLDNRGLNTPEAWIQSNHTSLVIREGSWQGSRKFSRGGLRLNDDPQSQKQTTPTETIQPPPPDGDHQQESKGATPPSSTANRGGSIPRDDPTPSPRQAQAASSASPSSQEAPPTTSPGYDYYQQVIGDSTPLSSGKPRTPAVAAAPAESSLVPTLTKEGYTVTPSLQELATMSEADLASVNGFTVSRDGHGMVAWEGAVDVRGANLDRIVRICEEGDISVYAQDEEEGIKPDEGSKLNRPARISFYGLFHKKGGDATEQELEDFVKRLTRKAKKGGAQFVSYDKGTGTWVIRAPHF